MKNIRKTIRFSEEEWQIILQKLETISLSFSEYARKSILKNKLKISSKTDEKMIYEINKIGVNLNQISRHINEKKMIDLNVLNELKKISKETGNLL